VADGDGLCLVLTESPDPNILVKPVSGVGISVRPIADPRQWMTVEEILAEYPDLKQAIRKALRYAAWTADDILYVPASASA
jgi:hypothetical protein